eukprot:TRINITY_DN10583_c0_g1_i1.p2 TRINITY_DN10583_c0_g1~~TRINITY_DN10583_c0_g1_i1.p2  ORF type:complete len:644 (-),score=241.54 TRINITY_DN10583_c0_g1_i1:254-2128(-)
MSRLFSLARVAPPLNATRTGLCRSVHTRAVADSTGIHYDPSTPMWKAQSKVPRLPIPALKTTCERYLESVAPLISESELKATQSHVQKFLSGEGPKLHEELERLDKESPTSWLEGFWDTMYLNIRDSLTIGVSPFLMLQDDPRRQNQVVRAANLVAGWVQFYDKVRSNAIEPDFEKDGPMDMSQYTRLFGSARIPAPNRDYVVTTYDSRHIVVISHDQYYALDVIKENGDFVSEAEIQANLRDIVAQSSRTASAAPGVGVLTTEDRNRWAALRTELVSDPHNAKALEVIDRGLFVLSLDPVAPRDLQDASELLLHRDGTNRWFDKLMVVVFKDGAAGTILEHTPIDGHTGLRLMQDYTEFAKSPVVEAPNNAPRGVTAKPITFNVSPTVSQGMVTAKQNINGLISVTQSKVLEFSNFGSKYIKASGFGPDSFIQMMFQLAYYRLYGKAESTYESANTKRFLAGRTETIRSVTPESVAFTKAWDTQIPAAEKLQLLKAAAESHVKRAKAAKEGQGVDRHLFGLRNLALHKQQRLARYEFPSIFVDPAYTTHGSNILSTSNVSAPFFRLFGFGAVHARGLGLAYNINNDSLVFDVTSYTGQAVKYADALEQAFLDAQKAIESIKKQ